MSSEYISSLSKQNFTVQTSVAYLGPWKTSTMDLFCDNIFVKKNPPLMYDKILNMSPSFNINKRQVTKKTSYRDSSTT